MNISFLNIYKRLCHYITQALLKQPNTYKTSIILIALTITAKIFGFLREIIIAHLFGASLTVDTYIVAFAIIHLSTIWIHSALTSGIPYMAKLLHTKGKLSFLKTASALIKFALISSFTFSFIAVIWGKSWAKFMAPGINISSSDLLQTFLIILFVWGISRILTLTTETIFIALNYQFPTKFSFTLQSVFSALSIVLLYNFTKNYTLPLSLTISSIIAFLCAMWLFSKVMWLKPALTIKPQKEGYNQLKEILRLGYPNIINTAQFSLYKTIDNYFASTLGIGSIACLNYATVLYSSISIINVATTPLLTKYGQLFGKKEFDKLEKEVEKAFRVTFWLFSLLAGVMIIFSYEIVAFVLRHGAFDYNALINTSSALSVYGFGVLILPFTLSLQGIPILLGYTWQRSLIATLSLSTNAFLDYLLVKPLGLAGLVWATNIGRILTLLLTFKLIQKNGLLKGFIRKNTTYIIKTLIILTLTSILTLFVQQNINLSLHIKTALAGITYLICWITMFYLLKLQTYIPKGWDPISLIIRLKEFTPIILKIKRLWQR